MNHLIVFIIGFLNGNHILLIFFCLLSELSKNQVDQCVLKVLYPEENKS